MVVQWGYGHQCTSPPIAIDTLFRALVTRVYIHLSFIQHNGPQHTTEILYVPTDHYRTHSLGIRWLAGSG